MIASTLWCSITLAGFAGARWLSGRLGHPPWASPVLMCGLALVALLAVLGVPLADYDRAARPLRWLLGPALVALATVIHGNRGFLKAEARPVLAAVIGGSLIGLGSAIGMVRLLGLEGDIARALTVKTVTAPFVVAIMTRLDGPVGLAAALSVLTGVIGALLIAPMLALLRLRDPAARGLATGVASHIVGTDWLTRRDPRGGALSALAFVLVGLVAAVLVPALWPWLNSG